MHGEVVGRAAALLNMRWKGSRGGRGGSVTKGRNGVVVVVGGGWHKRIDNDCFFKHYYFVR